MLSIVFNYSGSLCHFSWSCILFMYSTPVIVPLLCGNVGIHFEDNNFIPFKKGTIESTNKAGYHTKLLIISNMMIFLKCERDNIV